MCYMGEMEKNRKVIERGGKDKCAVGGEHTKDDSMQIFEDVLRKRHKLMEKLSKV